MVGVRLYSQGFAHAVRAIYALEKPTPQTSRLWVQFEWIPRNPIWRVFLMLGARWLHARYTEVLAGLEKELAAGSALTAFKAPAAALSPDANARLESLAARVTDTLRARGVDTSAVGPLASFVRSGDDMDLFRIRPRALAKELGLADDVVLHTFLVGTREGLFQLTWDLICPHCRGVRQSPSSLADVPQRASCDVCQIEFGVEEENAVEVSFHVHPSVRAVPPVFFCSAEPAKKRHIVVQQALAPGQKRVVPTALAPGRYRARTGKLSFALDVGRDGARELVWRASSAVPAEQRAAVDATITLENDTSADATFVVEDARWADDALRPADVFALPAFRDLFSRESLAAGVRLAIGEQTILFTDMVGSTVFYEDKGDAEAFLEVRKHFAEVFAAVTAEKGTVVKTIGDAVMAAYPSPVDALRSAARIQRLFPAERADTPVRLRVSLHKGACLAVNLDTGVDYFGRTVNVAAKLQALADAHEVAFPKALLDEAGVRDVVTGSVEDAVLKHSAYPQGITVLRWRP
jgi:class 3 adenylate cyclase